MSTALPLVALKDLPEKRGKRVCVAGLDLALFKIGDAVYAIEDSCPHAGASLSNGKLQGLIVSCPAHGLRFNVATGGAVGAPGLVASCHPVGINDGVVMLLPALPADD